MLLATTGGGMGQVYSTIFTIELGHWNEIDLFKLFMNKKTIGKILKIAFQGNFIFYFCENAIIDHSFKFLRRRIL